MYFGHKRGVPKCDLPHTLHALSYDYFQGFQRIPAFVGLIKHVFLMIFNFDIFSFLFLFVCFLGGGLWGHNGPMHHGAILWCPPGIPKLGAGE